MNIQITRSMWDRTVVIAQAAAQLSRGRVVITDPEYLLLIEPERVEEIAKRIARIAVHFAPRDPAPPTPIFHPM
jgi:hypothetical protein